MLNFVRKYKYILLIFLLAFVLRVYKLGTFPVGFQNDEVKVGWNALSILKTGKDDRGNRFALYYNSFGDYRPTGIFYIDIPSIALLGRNVFAVRFPSAVLGALSVLPLYLIVLKISKKKNLALIAALLLAIYPWHISTSRATSEVVISLFFTLSGLYLFLKYFSNRSFKYLPAQVGLISSIILLTVSYFFYPTARLLVPLFIGAIIVYYRKFTKTVLISWGILVLLVGILSLNPEARGRFSQVSIFNDLNVQYELTRMPFEEGQGKVLIARLFHNKPIVYARRFVNEYANYFSADFFLNPDVAKPARYTTVGVGLLTYIELGLLILGLVSIAQKKSSWLPLALLLLAPIPAALTTEDAPNLHRALFMIPFICIIGAFGFDWLHSLFPQKRIIHTSLYIILFLNFIFYLHMYYVHNPVHLNLYRNDGASQVVLKLNSLQKNYDKILLTDIPDDLYPWIAFLTGKDPATFNADAIKRDKGDWSTENYYFTGLRCPSRDAFNKPDVKRLLVVDAEGCATESNLINRSDVVFLGKILRSDRTEVYNLWSRIEK